MKGGIFSSSNRIKANHFEIQVQKGSNPILFVTQLKKALDCQSL